MWERSENWSRREIWNRVGLGVEVLLLGCTDQNWQGSFLKNMKSRSKGKNPWKNRRPGGTGKEVEGCNQTKKSGTVKASVWGRSEPSSEIACVRKVACITIPVGGVDDPPKKTTIKTETSKCHRDLPGGKSTPERQAKPSVRETHGFI